jgi:hypothetical protein
MHLSEAAILFLMARAHTNNLIFALAVLPLSTGTTDIELHPSAPSLLINEPALL